MKSEKSTCSNCGLGIFTYYCLPKQDKAKKLDDMIIFQILIMSFSFSLYAGLMLEPAKSAHLMDCSMVSTCATLHVKRIRFSYNHHTSSSASLFWLQDSTDTAFAEQLNFLAVE